jgi:predicted DCC family thiol-disulfide oxidoreductase YuxK
MTFMPEVQLAAPAPAAEPTAQRLRALLDAPADANVIIVYDGECPFCSAYVRLLRLRQAAGKAALLDARQNDRGKIVQRETGLDLNRGMIAIVGERLYWGDEAVHALALLTSPVGLFNRVNAAILANRLASRLLYPLLRFGRNSALMVKGKPQIDLT